jgi:branched-subunit amino acid aminotransferase/4-amino-4-deoxychorismate lyase
MTPASQPAQQVDAVAVIDGLRLPLAQAALPLTDDGVARGDGAFETIGVWGGRPFRLPDHLERLGRSLEAIGLPRPDAARLGGEIDLALEGLGSRDAALRLFVIASGTRVVTVSAQPVRAALRHLAPQPAPWIRPPAEYPAAGAKTMSYGPNMAATRRAQRDGADDALLLSSAGHVCEGPTFCVLWVRDGRLCTPAVELGIVDSISRRSLLQAAAELGRDVEEGHWQLEDLEGATEFIACSSVRPVKAVRRVGAWRFDGPTPTADALAAALEAWRRGRR